MFPARRAIAKVARAHKITICRRIPNTQTTCLLKPLSTKPLIENHPETLSINQREMDDHDTSPKFPRWPIVLGITTTFGIAAFWLYNREVVPFSGRKRFRFIDLKWHARYDARSDPDIKKGLEMLDNGHKNPELLWPDDHPTTKIVRRIFSKLIAESGLDHIDWDVQILNTKDSSTPRRYSTVMVIPDGKAVVFTEGLKKISDEAELAAILSQGISEVAIGFRAERYCNSWLDVGLGLTIAELTIAMQLEASTVLWVVALPALTWALFMHSPSIYSNQKVQKQETDYVSMAIMSKAGYDPRAYINNAKKIVKVNESSLKRMDEELAFKIKRGQEFDPIKKCEANRLRSNIKVEEENVWKMVQTVPEIMEKSGTQIWEVCQEITNS